MNQTPDNYDGNDPELEEQLYARHAEISSFEDLEKQRGTPIPALFSAYYKFIQNPSSVSVETFKRMVDTDDTIGSGIDFLATALTARLGAYQHKSQEVTQYVNDRLNEIDGGWTNVVKELFSASWAGYSVAEKVWANTPNGFTLKKLVQLPPSTILFEVDRTGELTDDGILQYQRNYSPGLSSSSNYMFGFIGNGAGQVKFRPDPFARLGDLAYPMRIGNAYSYMTVRIPKLKCVHYAFDAQGKFGNPYGRSLLRRCHKWWVMKDAFLNMMAVALDRKGTPLQVVFCDPNLTVLDQATYGPGNRPESQGKLRGDMAAKRAFQNIHNDTTIFLPGKKDQHYSIENVPQASNAGDFLQAIQECNKGIMRALLLPALIFTGGDGSGSYSLGQEHSKTFDKVCDGILAGLKQTLLQQVVKELLAYNFPSSVWEKDGVGDFGKRSLSPEEIEKELAAIEKGVQMGAIDNNNLNDMNKVRELLNFEPTDTLPVKQDMFSDGQDSGQDEQQEDPEKPKESETDEG